jgi:hypothetical protein
MEWCLDAGKVLHIGLLLSSSGLVAVGTPVTQHGVQVRTLHYSYSINTRKRGKWNEAGLL